MDRGFITRALALAFGLIGGAASATPVRAGATTFDLGGGRSATRTVTYRPRASVRIDWTVSGFSPPPEQPIAFAQAGAGRLVALVEPSGAMFSDDGRQWHASQFAGAVLSNPTAIDFSRSLGALVTEVSGVWVSRDGGETWRLLRERGARALDDVAVVGDQVVYTDDHGGVWVIDVNSSALRTLSESGTSGVVALVRMSDGSIRTQGADGCAWRIDSSGLSAAR